MMSWRRNDYLKVAVLLPLVLVSTYFAIATANIVSLTQETRLSMHSLFVYWACIPTAVILISLIKEFKISLMSFCAAFICFIVARVARAIDSFLGLGEVATITSINVAARMIEITIVAGFLLVGIIVQRFDRELIQRKRNWIYPLSIITVILAFEGVLFYFVLPNVTESLLHNIVLVTSLISCLILAIIPFLYKREQNPSLQIDSGYLLSGSLLLILTVVFFLFSVTDNSQVWILGENIQIAAFFVLGLSICVPYMRRKGFSRITSYTVFTSLSIITYLPLLVTTLLESINLTSGISIMNPLAYTIIHVGVGSLSIMMVILVYAYSRVSQSVPDYPLILLFSVWSGVAITTVFFYYFRIHSYIGESIISYFVGGAITIILLHFIAVFSTRSPEGRKQRSTREVISIALLLFLAIVVSEIGDQVILYLYPSILSANLGQLLLIITNFILMLIFSFTVYLLVDVSDRSISFELYVVSFLSFWILPITLKSFYTIWTLGWWVSELIIFIGVLLGPVILSLLYIQSMREVNESHARAKLYADLLMHDITNYNQMALTTMELLASEHLAQEEIERVISDAQRAIEMANQLVSNVRLLNETDEWLKKPLFTIDLVPSIVRTVDLVTKSQRYPERIIRLGSETVHAYVMGNEFLDYAIINFLYTALAIPSRDCEVLLTINPTSNFDEKWWSIQIDIPDVLHERTGKDPIDETLHERLEQTLGYQVAKLIVEQMDGYVEIQRTIDDDSISLLMALNLPVSPEIE